MSTPAMATAPITRIDSNARIIATGAPVSVSGLSGELGATSRNFTALVDTLEKGLV